MTLRHGSLFSGIGGMDLGFERAGIETAWQVEMNPFCRRVLAKNFPKAKRFPDVRECGRRNLEQVDIVSGGFPCQDISTAGNMAGINGMRSRLFWQLARIVRELRPAWVLIENVSRLLHTDGDQVLSQMESAGYRCWPTVLGAREIGATHRRSRAWVLCRRADADGLDLPPVAKQSRSDAVRSLAEAVEKWRARADLLASVPRAPGPDAYARVLRECDGIPDWVDRLGALGNAVVPQIPELFARFIRSAEDGEAK